MDLSLDRLWVASGEGVWTVPEKYPRWSGDQDAARQGVWLIDDENWAKKVCQRLWALVDEIRDEIRDYELAAVRLEDDERRRAAEITKEWLEGAGMRVVSELEDQIARANFFVLREMNESIEAASELRRIARRRDLQPGRNRDMLLQWCRETLLSLRRAFDDLSSESIELRLDTPEEWPVVKQWTRDPGPAYSLPPSLEPMERRVAVA